MLEKKGYVGHKAYGNVHLYHPLVSKSDYSKSQLFGLMESYFNNSFPAMASFFAREKDLTVKELDELLEETKKELSRERKKKVMEAFALYLIKSVIWLTGFALVYHSFPEK